MIVNITGPHGGKPYNNQIADKIRGGVVVMAVKLGLGHLPITYNIKLGRQLNRTSDGARGYTGVSKKYNKYYAEIFLMREDKISAIISTLAHEMIHVKHFIKDGLDLEKAKFKGKKWAAKAGQDDYRNSPWEEDAHKNEEILANHYLRYCRANRIK